MLYFCWINATLGFPGVFPQRPGQDEDQMTPSNVKTGYIDKGIIQASVNDMVYTIIIKVDLDF